MFYHLDYALLQNMMKYPKLIEKYKDLLEMNFPKPTKKKKTFLEIGRVPHYENVISNFYGFYLDDTEEHNFKRLFLKSLLEIIHVKTSKVIEFDDYSVYTEVSTNKGGRIDILIEETDETKAIIIENKIYHELNNNLEDYWTSTNAISKNKVGVLLTLKKTKPNHTEFLNITHSQLIEQVQKNIGSYLESCDDRHLFFIKDLFINIQSLTTNKNEMKNTLKFYFENREKINELSNMQEIARKHFLNQIKVTGSTLGLEVENGKHKDNRCLIISTNPSIRLWIQMFIDPESDFLVIFLDLFGESKGNCDLLIENKTIKTLANKKNIEIEKFGEERGGISIASISYSFDSDNFVNIGDYIATKIKSDWLEFYELIIKVIKEQNGVPNK